MQFCYLHSDADREPACAVKVLSGDSVIMQTNMAGCTYTNPGREGPCVVTVPGADQCQDNKACCVTVNFFFLKWRECT